MLCASSRDRSFSMSPRLFATYINWVFLHIHRNICFEVSCSDWGNTELCKCRGSPQPRQHPCPGRAAHNLHSSECAACGNPVILGLIIVSSFSFASVLLCEWKKRIWWNEVRGRISVFKSLAWNASWGLAVPCSESPATHQELCICTQQLLPSYFLQCHDPMHLFLSCLWLFFLFYFFLVGFVCLLCQVGKSSGTTGY